jgi:3-methyladenine DNA glycosylase AlkD
MKAAEVRRHLRQLGSPERAKGSLWFFKTGPGDYGEGDQFLGLNAAEMHAAARQFATLPLVDCEKLLDSKWHEERLVALLIMGRRYPKDPQAVYRLYLRKTDRINNWDLVDCSAAGIVGAHLFERDRRPLLWLAKSKSLWERRIAIIATYHFIRRGEFEETFRIAEILLHDEHDLIHKAVGWMLREVGKRVSQSAEEEFLQRHATGMPRTMLRYAIERFSPELRRKYMGMKRR